MQRYLVVSVVVAEAFPIHWPFIFILDISLLVNGKNTLVFNSWCVFYYTCNVMTGIPQKSNAVNRKVFICKEIHQSVSEGIAYSDSSRMQSLVKANTARKCSLVNVG